jgi:drug/metabolite transporter (DMT)-like permease
MREDRSGEAAARPMTEVNRPAPGGRSPALGLALIGLLTLSWGLHWPIVKIGLSEVPPFTLRAIGTLASGVALIAIAAASGKRLWPRRREAVMLLWLSLANVTAWQMLTAFGLLLMPAGRAVILAYTMPIWSVLLGRAILHEVIDRTRLAGLVLGIGAMALLLGDDIAVVHRAPLGALLMIGAALAWAIGTVFTKRFEWTVSLPAMVGWQLALAAPPIVLGAVLFEADRWALPSLWPAFAVLYTVVVAGIIAHLLWFRLLQLYPAGVAAISALLIPVVGLLAGAAILDERIGTTELIALVLVVSALAAVHGPALRRGFRGNGVR